MNTDPVLRTDDEPSRPLVDWYPRGGPLRAVSLDVAGPTVLALGAVGLGVLAYAGFALARRGARTRFGELEVDRLVVRKLTVLDR